MLQKFRVLNKDAKIALLLLVIGWMYFWVVSYFNYLDYVTQFNDRFTSFWPKPGKFDTVYNKIICICFGIVALFFSFKIKKTEKYRRTLIILSVVFLLISYFFFINVIFEIEYIFWELFSQDTDMIVLSIV